MARRPVSTEARASSTSSVSPARADRPQPVSAPDLGALIQGYGVRLNRAVQANLRYPPAARAMGQGGQTQVQFYVAAGRVQDVRVLTSSGSDLLDQAAVRAVQTLPCPPVPAELTPKRIPFALWVHFDSA